MILPTLPAIGTKIRFKSCGPELTGVVESYTYADTPHVFWVLVDGHRPGFYPNPITCLINDILEVIKE